MMDVCYTSLADKRERYASETIPAIIDAAGIAVRDPSQSQILRNWLVRSGVSHDARSGSRALLALHCAVRNAPYRSFDRVGCDHVQSVPQTLARGGDCDNWAAVMIAAATLMGFHDIRLLTTGDEADPFRHVAVAVHDDGVPYLLDPKYRPDSKTLFNTRADAYPLAQLWRVPPLMEAAPW